VARIYLSATYGDLKEHREQAYRALRQLGHDVIAMEDYVATDERPLAKCLDDVAACDLYVGIVAHRYGYIPDHDNPDGRSITELEYRHAQALGIPRLVFLLDEAALWLPGWMDAVTGDGDHGGRIRALRDELGRERLVNFFATSDELAQKVSVAVTKQLDTSRHTYRLVEGLPAVPARRAWTVPPPVRSFTGRVEQMTALHTQLTGRGAATLVPTAALTGMGGVGKTQLALAYAQRYRADYQLGWWVPAETELGMVTALADLAVVLGLPAELPPAELAAGARDALGERSGWLVIFDNAPDPAAVAEYLPGAGGGHVLVTSRDSAWQGIADPVPVDVLSQQEAVGLLLRRSGDSDKPSAARLADALGRLPLALEQAATYAASQGLPLARYLALFDQRRYELLALGRPLAYQGTVDATFTLALDQLRETNPAAGQLLELCALLALDEIPLPLLLSQPRLLPELLAAAVADPMRQGEVVGVLYRQGLLTRDAGDTARMHRLVQDVTLAHLPPADRHQRIVDAVELLAGLFPHTGEDPDGWPRSGQLLGHAQAVVDHARALELTSPELSELLDHAGRYLWGRGLDVQLARQFHEQALAMRQRLFDGDHPDVAASLSNLAVTLSGFGEYERARELDEQALAMRQRLFDGDHPDVAASLNNLAADLRAVGEDGRARELDEQALAMRQRLFDGDHPDVAASLSNLAVTLSGFGEYGRARELDEQALAMRQRLFDGDHPDVAASLSKLAVTLSGLGEYERARELREQALAMRQRLFDGDHPDVAQGVEGNLPDAIRLLSLLGIDDIEPDVILDRWQQRDHGHQVLIGESLSGPFAVDLVTDGPHALIVGATGSGKSELLRTLITSLAVANPPDRVTFLLMDYKGGEAFDEFRQLPHTVGLINDFDAHLAQRALTSLGAEVRRREQILANSDANDIDQYATKRASDPALPPLPRLLLFVDEFSSISEAAPTFIPGLLSIAQGGRSLGIHLILATQRISERVSQFRALINLRIALRVNDRKQSIEVIETVDAARIRSGPGRGYARLGPDVLIPFQTGWVEGDLAVLAQAVSDAARQLNTPPPHRPLLPPLADRLRLEDLPDPEPITGRDLAPVVYGLEDLPAEQSYRPASLDLTGPTHLLVSGDPGSGRSQFLRTFAGAIARQHSRADVHLYAIDCGSGALLALRELPHCGAVVTQTETTRAARLLNRLTADIRRRQELLAEGGFASATEQRRAVSDRRRLPHLLLLIDGWERFIENLGRVHDGQLANQVAVLVSDGGRVGIHLVLAGDQHLLQESFSIAISDRLVLPLSDRNDLSLAGIRPNVAPTAWRPGHGLRADSGVAVQVALLDGEPNQAGQAAALAAMAETVRVRDATVPLAQQPFRVDEVPLVADRFHVGDAQGRPVGREDVLAWLRDRHATGASAALLGPRRAGKSWVLAELSGRLRDDGSTSVHELVLPMPSSHIDTADALAALLDRSVARRASPTMALLDKARLHANAADRLVFLLDEVGRLVNYQPAAVSWLRDLGQAGAWLVYTGSEQDWHTVVRWALKAPGSSFGNDVNARVLGPWEERTALRFISGTAANLGVDLPPDTTGKAIIELVGTWPFYLQVVGDAMVRAVQGGDFAPLSHAGALRQLVQRRLIDEWRDLFEGRWAEIGRAGRSALLAQSNASPQSLAPAQRKDLRDTGLLRPGDRWLVDPPFFVWVARNAASLRDQDL